MKDRYQALLRASIIVSAAALLFVVLFPYTPTPIATHMGKLLVAVFCGFALFWTKALVLTSNRLLPSAPLTDFLSGHEILNLICVRLR